MQSALHPTIHSNLTKAGFFKVFHELHPNICGYGVFQRYRMDDFMGTYFAIYNGKRDIIVFTWQKTVRYIPVIDIVLFGMTCIGDAFDDNKITRYHRCDF